MPAAAQRDFFDVIRRELSIVFAIAVMLIKRDAGADGTKLLLKIAEPIAVLSVMVLLWQVIGRTAPLGLEWEIFLATGLVTLNFYKNAAGCMMAAKGWLRSYTSIPVISELHVALAMLLSQSLTGIVTGFVLISGLVAMGWATGPQNFSMILLLIPVALLFNLGHMMINHAMIVLTPAWKYAFLVLNRPLLILSGVLYLNETLPQNISIMFSYMPSAQFILWFRDAYFVEYTSTNLSYSYTIQFSVSMLIAGLVLQRLMRRKIRGS